MLRMDGSGSASRARGRGAMAHRSRARRTPGRALAAHRLARGVAGEERLASSAGFNRSRERTAASLMRPRVAPLGVALLLTAAWFLANVRRLSPLDILPFAWTWVTLWLALSVAFELWCRYAGTAVVGRRRP